METHTHTVVIEPERTIPAVTETRYDLIGLTATEAEIIAVALSKQDKTLKAKDAENGTEWAKLADHMKRSLFKRTRGYTANHHECFPFCERWRAFNGDLRHYRPNGEPSEW